MKPRITCLLIAFLSFAPLAMGQTQAGSARTQFEPLTAHAGVFHDVVNVGVIQAHGKTLLIGSGDGSILEATKNLGIKPVEWVLYTDHHRDQCASAGRLKKAGLKIGVPAA